MAKQYNVTVTKNPDATVEIKGEISWEAFSAFEQKAFERLAAHLELDGFRKGNVPENVARKHLGEELILSDMAELAMQEFYPTIIKDEELDVIGRPELSITKLAHGNALGFTMRSAVLPDIKLPNYKKIAKDISAVQAVEVTEADVDKVIEDLRQIRAYGHVHGEHETHDHAHEEPLPEVNDEFAKSFGDFERLRKILLKRKDMRHMISVVFRSWKQLSLKLTLLSQQ
jgi:FKBP-type peptidyl-prolyl cis-trans isomerase (trigger factor)